MTDVISPANAWLTSRASENARAYACLSKMSADSKLPIKHLEKGESVVLTEENAIVFAHCAGNIECRGRLTLFVWKACDIKCRDLTLVIVDGSKIGNAQVADSRHVILFAKDVDSIINAEHSIKQAIGELHIGASLHVVAPPTSVIAHVIA